MWWETVAALGALAFGLERIVHARSRREGGGTGILGFALLAAGVVAVARGVAPVSGRDILWGLAGIVCTLAAGFHLAPPAGGGPPGR